MSKFNIDNDTIRQLAELLDETNLTEIEVAAGDNRIRVARQGTMVAAGCGSCCGGCSGGTC